MNMIAADGPWVIRCCYILLLLCTASCSKEYDPYDLTGTTWKGEEISNGVRTYHCCRFLDEDDCIMWHETPEGVILTRASLKYYMEGDPYYDTIKIGSLTFKFNDDVTCFSNKNEKYYRQVSLF